MTLIDARSAAGGAFTRDEPITSLEVVYKISERCNLACDYCYFFFRGDESYRTHPALAAPEVSEALGRFIDRAVAEYDIRTVNVVLHGGEPLLMPRARLVRLCQSIRDGYSQAAPLRFAMQTNGALLTPEWVTTLCDLDIGVGISFDGPPELHDVHRFDRKGRGSYADVRRGWELLREATARGEGDPPGLLCVINPDVDADRVFDHFVDDLGARQMNFLIPDYHHDDPLPAGYVEGVGDYMIRVFNNWARRRDRDLSVRFIRESLSLLAKPELLRNPDAPPFNDLRNQISIASNGEIYPEDTVKILDGFRQSRLTVLDASLADVFESEPWQTMSQAVLRMPEQCRGCDWRKICNGGRMHNRFSKARGLDNPSVFCEALQAYFEHITAALVKGGASLDDIYASLTA